MSLAASENLQAKSAAFQNGAEWIRADFHLHTKADREFKYAGEESDYVNAYVDSLEKAEIRLGVITNHNKFDYSEFKTLRSASKKKGITLLPGVELSVNDGANGIHALIVFSEAWLENGQDHINPFLGVAFEGKTPSQYELENGRSSQSLAETIKKLEGYHRDFFIIFAHVEQNSGLWKELDGGRLEDLGKNEFFQRRTLGFQKVRTHDGAGSGKPSRVKIQQWLKNWYPAEVEGSDPKTVDEIGKGDPCYVKLGELSFEAIKFALGDPASRVVKERTKHNASYIHSVQFEGGILNGQTLHFSPGLNALIGIRGSGKSSIVETLRYVLDIPRGDRSQDIKYKEDLPKHTLGSGGKITLTALDVYGQKFTVSRIFRESPTVYVEGKLQPGVSIRETVLRRPIYFGQKDLSSTGDGFETDLVEKLVAEKLSPLRAEIASQRQQVREIVQRLQKLSTTADQKRDYEAQLSDAEFRLKKFEEYGIADKLQKRIGFDRDASALESIYQRVENFIDELSQFIAVHEDELRNSILYTSKDNPSFFEGYFVEYRRIIDQLTKLKQIEIDTKATASCLETKSSDFSVSRKNLQEEFAQIERQIAEDLKQSGATAIQPDEFVQQQQRKTKAIQMLEALTKQDSQKTNIQTTLLQELDKLNNLWLKEFNTVKAELDRVNSNSSALQLIAEFKGEKDEAVSYMQQLFRGSNIRENTLRSAMSDYADFGDFYRNIQNAKNKMGSSPDAFESLFLQNLADFITWQVPNRFKILYRDKELKHHSLGQRASALILYVLSQRENDVIIIDQPEDDLDNQTIYEDVIKLIREMKPFTQFIFATHNANFPVLGDAEQVHACHFQDETMHLKSGSIDSRPIQDAIINIMEGGEEAFSKRKEVYSSWKPQNSSK